MKQGVLTPGRVRLLLHRGLVYANLVIVKKGENDLPGLTDTEKPRMRGPKRASKIRKLFNLNKDDDVRKYVNTYRRTFTNKADNVSVFFIELYDLILTMQAIMKGTHTRTVRSCARSPSGKMLTTASFDATTAVLENTGGEYECVSTFETRLMKCGSKVAKGYRDEVQIDSVGYCVLHYFVYLSCD
ncbi:hypothetical protein KSS87_020518 [Heliosperma pusillum]|nr:hypothetical protein KSS87_020518 [Heliosperma pusillum]